MRGELSCDAEDFLELQRRGAVPVPLFLLAGHRRLEDHVISADQLHLPHRSGFRGAGLEEPPAEAGSGSISLPVRVRGRRRRPGQRIHRVQPPRGAPGGCFAGPDGRPHGVLQGRRGAGRPEAHLDGRAVFQRAPRHVHLAGGRQEAQPPLRAGSAGGRDLERLRVRKRPSVAEGDA